MGQCERQRWKTAAKREYSGWHEETQIRCRMARCSHACSTSAVVFAQTTAATAPKKDSSYIDAQGTTHVTCVVPLPQTVTPQARRFLARPLSDAPSHLTVRQRRASTNAWQARAGAAYEKVYPVREARSTIAGVPVRIIIPLTVPPEKQDRVVGPSYCQAVST
jgi:hypothetical protein